MSCFIPQPMKVLESDAPRVKKKFKKIAATLSQIFLLLNLTPPQITLFFSLLSKTETQQKKIKNAIWCFYFQVCGSSSFSSLAFPLGTPVTSFPGWPWAADWQGAVCIRATSESGSKTAPDKQAGGDFPSRPSVWNIYRCLFSLLDHQGQTNVHQLIQTFHHLFCSYSFSPFQALVPTFPLLHLFLVLTFPRLPTVFSPASPPSISPFSIILSTSNSATFCSFVLKETSGLSYIKKKKSNKIYVNN